MWGIEKEREFPGRTYPSFHWLESQKQTLFGRKDSFYFIPQTYFILFYSISSHTACILLRTKFKVTPFFVLFFASSFLFLNPHFFGAEK
jgi:hypothetical protein